MDKTELLNEFYQLLNDKSRNYVSYSDYGEELNPIQESIVSGEIRKLEPFTREEISKATPDVIHHCFYHGQFEMIHFLLELDNTLLDNKSISNELIEMLPDKIDLVKTIIKQYTFPITQELILNSFCYPEIEYLLIELVDFQTFSQQMMYHAIASGSLEAVQYLLRIGIELDPETLNISFHYGSYEIFVFFYQSGLKFDHSPIHYIRFNSDQLEILFFLDYDIVQPYLESIIHHILNTQDLNMFIRLLKWNIPPEQLFASALKEHRLDCAEYLIHQGIDPDLTKLAKLSRIQFKEWREFTVSGLELIKGLIVLLPDKKEELFSKITNRIDSKTLQFCLEQEIDIMAHATEILTDSLFDRQVLDYFLERGFDIESITENLFLGAFLAQDRDSIRYIIELNRISRLSQKNVNWIFEAHYHLAPLLLEFINPDINDSTPMKCAQSHRDEKMIERLINLGFKPIH